MREERAKAENKPMWILWRKHRSSLDKNRDFFFKLFLAFFWFLATSHFDRHLKVRYVLSARRRARKESV